LCLIKNPADKAELSYCWEWVLLSGSKVRGLVPHLQSRCDSNVSAASGTLHSNQAKHCKPRVRHRNQCALLCAGAMEWV
jgi:hypothetical protein